MPTSPIPAPTNLFEAVKAKEPYFVRQMINPKVDINRRDSSGYTALHHAAVLDCYGVAQILLDAEADRGATTNEGYTAIMLAAFAGQRTMVETLGSDRIGKNSKIVQTTNERGVERPSATMSWKEMNKSFKKMGKGEYRDTFMNAVKQSDVVMAARMLANGGISLSEQDKSGETPLVLAARLGDDEMIRLLLCNGAKTNETDKQINSPLLHAVTKRNLSAIRALMNAGADAEQVCRNRWTPLSAAIENNDTEVLAALLDSMIGSGKLHEIGPKILCEAASKGKTKTVRMLLARNMDLPVGNGSFALTRMVKNKNLDAVKTLLKAGADAECEDFDGHTAFTLAAANGLEGIVNALFDHRPKSRSREEWIEILQNETDNDGRTALMLAVLNAQTDMTFTLLQNKADIHKTDKRGRNAMLWAAEKGGATILGHLNTYPAAPFVRDNDENNVFLAAAAGNRKDVLQSLILIIGVDSPININSPNIYGDTPLIVAARRGYTEIVQLLLDSHANYIHRNKKGQSALLEALSNKHIKIYELLHAKLTEREKNLPKVNPLVHAVIKTIIEFAPAARDVFPALPALKNNQTDNEGNSELHMLAKGGHHEALQKLLAPRPKPGYEVGETIENMSDDDDEIGLEEAKSGPTVLQPENLSIEIQNNEGLTPLCEAVRYGRYDAAKVLLEGGANANHASGTGVKPLWLACRPRLVEAHSVTPVNTSDSMRPSTDLVKLLLEHGATLDAPSFDKQTPLMAASAAGDSLVVECLLKAGANISLANDHGFTPLMFASYFGHVGVTTILLRYSAAPNPGPGNKLSALLLAAENGHDDVVRLLLEHRAEPNYQHEDKSTALTVASAAGKVSTVTLLLLSGAKRYIQDKFGKNAMDYAMANGHHAVIQALKVQQTSRDN